MTITCTTRQLAAHLVNDPLATLQVMQGMGGFSVAVCYRVPGASEYSLAWLASSRAPEVIRDFSAVDAALRSAAQVYRLANPTAKTGHVECVLDLHE